MRVHKRVILATLVVAFFCISAYSDSALYADTVSDLKSQKEQALKKAEELSSAREELENQLSGLNSQMYELSASIDELASSIEIKEIEIEEAKLELEATKESATEQYEAMKRRIQFSYENSGIFSWTMLFDSENFTDFLNRAQYMVELNQSDRKLLESYQETLALVEANMATLEAEKEELSLKQKELQGKQEQLQSAAAQAQKQMSENEAAIGSQTALAGELESQIKAMQEYEKSLEAQKPTPPKEEAQKQEEDLSGEVSPVDGDLALLAALIYCEAGAEPYEGQVAVGSVVLNRVKSSNFPNTISGVIYQKSQFSPAGSGRLAVVLENNLATKSCYNAANEVLSGKISGNWLYFRMNRGIIDGTVIGNQVFY